MSEAAKPAKAVKANAPWRPRILFWTVLLPVTGLFLPTLTVLALAMLPTLGAYVAERSRDNHLVVTVGLMNFCGSLPVVVKLWSGGQSFAAIGPVLHDVFGWLVAYGAAGIGWGIYLLMPPIVASYYRVASETHVRLLKHDQRKLAEVWGEAVAELPEAGAPPGAG
jgi:hypothetical protein